MKKKRLAEKRIYRIRHCHKTHSTPSFSICTHNIIINIIAIVLSISLYTHAHCICGRGTRSCMTIRWSQVFGHEKNIHNWGIGSISGLVSTRNVFGPSERQHCVSRSPVELFQVSKLVLLHEKHPIDVT